MANYRDDYDLDRQAQINELVMGQGPGGGIQAPVDPATAGVVGPASDPVADPGLVSKASDPISNPNPGTKPGQTYAMGGFDAGKLADPGHNTEKYQVGRVFQKYDPAAGLTPELLAELNALDIGDFSGEGDKLSVKGARNGARWTDGMGDVIQNYSGEGPKTWTYLDTAPGGGEAGAAPAGSMDAGAAGNMDAGALMPVGDAYGSEGFFQRLLAQLQEQIGPKSTDREALLKEMGA